MYRLSIKNYAIAYLFYNGQGENDDKLKLIFFTSITAQLL